MMTSLEWMCSRDKAAMLEALERRRGGGKGGVRGGREGKNDET